VTFRDTQLGRFGNLCTTHFAAHADPDMMAAHALADDGVANPHRPTLQVVLDEKKLFQGHANCQLWQNSFATLVANYRNVGGQLLPVVGITIFESL
jgi:hypothetical protein